MSTPSVAQLMMRSGLAVRHQEPTITEMDWRVTGHCPSCRGEIFTLRRGTDFGRQEEHALSCRKPV